MLNKLTILLFCFILSRSVQAQYYLRGEIKDEMNNSLPNVKIEVHSSGYIYHSGSSGGFGITIPTESDSLTISADGFFAYSASFSSSKYQVITLKMRYASSPAALNRLVSLTKNLKQEYLSSWTVAAETYSSLVENEFIPAARFPETGFAMNINKASYSNIRRFLNMGNIVPPDAIRVEEMLNYFNYGYSEPKTDSSFSFRSSVSLCPWNTENALLFLNVCAKKANMDSIPPANLVFLIDVSGSMDLPNRLPLLKSAFSLMINNLRSKDTVSIVVYGGTTGVWLTPTSGGERKKILESIESLEAGGATPGEAGIRTAYRLAKSQYIKGGNNRVILATDGDFNVGERSDEELEQLINGYRSADIYLTCLGVGMGNYKDSKLELLAKRGNGNFAYLDNEKEAEKVLMQEFAQTIYAVAKDVYLDIRFDTAVVKDYRLIGFDNKLNALTDSSDQMQGGEIGSGQSMISLFEIHPAHGLLADSAINKPDFAKLSLHYKLSGDTMEKTTFYSSRFTVTRFQDLPSSYRFASSVTLFGGLLRRSIFTGKATWEDAERLALESYDSNDVAQKEYVELIEKAKKIYGREKKKKKTQVEN